MNRSNTAPETGRESGRTELDRLAAKQAHDSSFRIEEEAQRQKMGNSAQPHSPNKAARTNEPNAGGKNRESGHRG